jgi:hypothetical protein
MSCESLTRYNEIEFDSGKMIMSEEIYIKPNDRKLWKVRGYELIVRRKRQPVNWVAALLCSSDQKVTNIVTELNTAYWHLFKSGT